MPFFSDMISLFKKGVKDERLYETLVLTIASLTHTLSNMPNDANSTKVSRIFSDVVKILLIHY